MLCHNYKSDYQLLQQQQTVYIHRWFEDLAELVSDLSCCVTSISLITSCYNSNNNKQFTSVVMLCYKYKSDYQLLQQQLQTVYIGCHAVSQL